MEKKFYSVDGNTVFESNGVVAEVLCVAANFDKAVEIAATMQTFYDFQNQPKNHDKAETN